MAIEAGGANLSRHKIHGIAWEAFIGRRKEGRKALFRNERMNGNACWGREIGGT